MITDTLIVYEDKDGKFHTRKHSSVGCVVGGVGSALLESFSDDDGALCLMNIKKDFISIKNDLGVFSRAVEVYGSNVVKYDNGVIICDTDSFDYYNNLEDVLDGCSVRSIYLFSQNNKKWFYNNKSIDIFLDLGLIHEIYFLFNKLIASVECIESAVDKVPIIKSFVNSDKDITKLCAVIGDILILEDNKKIFNYLNSVYGRNIDVESIVNEVKILNVHDGLDKKISMPNKEIIPKKRIKI